MKKLIGLCLWSVFCLSSILLLGCKQTQEPRIPEEMGSVALAPQVRSPSAVGVIPNSGYVYVVSRYGGASVLKDGELITTLSVGAQSIPTLAVDTNRDLVYVISEYDNIVTVIKETEVVTTINVIQRSPENIAVDEKTGLVYVLNTDVWDEKESLGWKRTANVTIIKDNQVIDNILLGPRPVTEIAIDSVNGYVYVGSVDGDVYVIKGRRVIAQYNVAASPQTPINSIDIDPNTGNVYVLCRTVGKELSRFNQGKLIDTAKIQGEKGTVRQLKVHSVTGDVYVMDYTREEVVIVRDMEVIGRVPVEWQPAKIAIDPVTGNVYVTGIGHSTLTIIHGTEVLTTVQTGWYPYGIGVNPENGWVYVANTNENSVMILGYE
jgi:DNA-binding beta-propeller fold protein YncE